MEEHEGKENCVITGSSTHNERIERLWRDIHPSVLVNFGNLFRTLEEERKLDHLNEVDIYILHYIFVSKINEALTSFAQAWNNHTVSTENNQTPNQMFILGMLSNLQGESSGSELDENEFPIQLQSNDAVSVPRCTYMPCPYLLGKLATEIDPYISTACQDHGKSLYLKAIELCGKHLTHGCNNCIG